MSPEIYNPQVANLQVTIHDIEEKIIKGQYFIKDLNEFNEFQKKIEEIGANYSKYYQSLKSDNDRKELRTYLAQGLDFLQVMQKIINILDNYYDVVGCVDSNIIQKDWADVCVIMAFRYVDNQLRNAITLGEKTGNETNFYEEQKNVLKGQRDILEVKVIDAVGRVLAKSQKEYNSMEVNSVYASDRLSDFRLDERFYNTLSLTAKMNYLELVMGNILRAQGVVTVNVEGKNIAERYVEDYRQYLLRYNNLKRLLQLNLQQVGKSSGKLNLELVSLYANLCISKQEIRKQILELQEEAKTSISTDSVMAVTALDGKNMYILKAQGEKFLALQNKYDGVKQALEAFGYEHEIKVIREEDEYKRIIKKEEEIYNRYQFLDSQKEKSTKVTEELEKIRLDILNCEVSLDFAMAVNFYASLKTAGVNESLVGPYTEIILQIESFKQTKKYTTEEKRKAFRDILMAIQSFSKREIQCVTPVIIFGESRLREAKDKKYDYPDFMKERILEVKEAYSSLVLEQDLVKGIRSSKSALNKDNIYLNVQRVAKDIAIHLGFMVFKKDEISFVPLNNNNNMSNSMNNQGIVAEVKPNVIKQEMGSSSYVYQFNGRYLTIDSMDPECDAKRAALETNGATLVESVQTIYQEQGRGM